MLPDRVRALPDVERALSWIVVGFNLVYTPVSALNFRQFVDSTTPLGAVVIIALLVVPLVLDAAVSSVRTPSRSVWALISSAYLLAVLSWPLFLRAPLVGSQPGWIVIMLIPAMLRLVMATRSYLATAIISIGVVAWLVVVQTVAGGVELADAVAGVVLVGPFGYLLTVIVMIVRRAAARTARAQRATSIELAAARLDDVTEAARVRTDALVHDIVLTTLLQASSSGDDDGDRARSMARNALRVIAHVNRAGDLGTGVRFRSAVSACERHLESVLGHFQVLQEDSRLEDLLLPSGAADALLTAMQEAMSNSVEHADARRRVLRVSPLGPDGLHIEITDDGRGFDAHSSTGAGIRDRILAPMMAVEGHVELHSTAGGGTSVQLSWGSVVVSDVRSLDARLVGLHA